MGAIDFSNEHNRVSMLTDPNKKGEYTCDWKPCDFEKRILKYPSRLEDHQTSWPFVSRTGSTCAWQGAHSHLHLSSTTWPVPQPLLGKGRPSWRQEKNLDLVRNSCDSKGCHPESALILCSTVDVSFNALVNNQSTDFILQKTEVQFFS